MQLQRMHMYLIFQPKLLLQEMQLRLIVMVSLLD